VSPANRIIPGYSRSQAPAWECLPRGFASQGGHPPDGGLCDRADLATAFGSIVNPRFFGLEPARQAFPDRSLGTRNEEDCFVAGGSSQ
jgi:hypothetical protein